MSNIDDIINSYVKEKLQEETDTGNHSEEEEGVSFDLFGGDDSSSSSSESSSSNISEDKITSNVDENKELNELQRINREQKIKIKTLEENSKSISELQSEINFLKQEILQIKGKRKTQRLDETQRLDDKTLRLDETQLLNLSDGSESSEDQEVKTNRTFDFIPNIVRKRRRVQPSYCGRAISTHRRFDQNVCARRGCIRCHLDNLVRSGYSVDRLREVRAALIKLVPD